MIILNSTFLVCSSKEALERIAYEYCEDSARQNVVYAEYRVNPFPKVPENDVVSGKDYLDGILAGLERGQKEFGVKIRCILSFLRDMPGTSCHSLTLLTHSFYSL